MVSKVASVVIVRNPQGQILAVTRKTDANVYCFPGGKLDPGEDIVQAATRELQEETGLVLDNALYLGNLHDGEFDTHCFYAISWSGNPRSLEPGVEVSWLSESEIGESRSAYPEYNTEMLKRMRTFLEQ